ncbi:hypothetical protein [Staphylococcus agnetis]|uniref:hypothetical protein n=1 Tax=Staphylococcus agnetis TaxID=985762 RepID=UPI0039E81472
MMKELTIENLKELLEAQEEFESKEYLINLESLKIAYAVKFFKWLDNLGFYNLWKVKSNSSESLNDLADKLAYGLSIANKLNVHINSEIIAESNEFLKRIEDSPLGLDDNKVFKAFWKDLSYLISKKSPINDDIITFVLVPINIAHDFYSIDELINTYKKNYG